MTGIALMDSVAKVLKMWEDKAIYDSKFINGLRATFERPRDFGVDLIKREAAEVDEAATQNRKLDPEKQYIFPKLVDIEKYLREEYKDNTENLEKKCRLNGISMAGTFEDIIVRMLNLEYFVLKSEYDEMKAQEKVASATGPQDLKTISGELELQLIVLRNRVVDLQKLYLNMDSEALDGAPITVEDINLLELPKELLQERRRPEPAEDPVDGAELLPDELKYIQGHEDEVFITVTLPE